MIVTKKCFNCSRNLPLIFFNKITVGYRREDWLGRVINCKMCKIKYAFKIGGIFERVGKRYEFKEANKIEILKKYLL